MSTNRVNGNRANWIEVRGTLFTWKFLGVIAANVVLTILSIVLSLADMASYLFDPSGLFAASLWVVTLVLLVWVVVKLIRSIRLIKHARQVGAPIAPRPFAMALLGVFLFLFIVQQTQMIAIRYMIGPVSHDEWRRVVVHYVHFELGI